jgi:enterochelin esterase-like enzyme
VTRGRAVIALALVAGTVALVLPARGASGLRGRVISTSLRSSALGRRERVLVYTPPGYSSNRARRYPVVILLHGVPGRPEEFVDHGLVARLDRLIAAGVVPPVLAVLPAGSDQAEDDNEWADSEVRPGERWETFLASDLVRWVDGSFRTLARRSARAIGGDSMGAFGAMNVALHHRDEFAAVSAWSGYFNANTPAVQHPGSALWRAYSPQLYAPSMQPPLRVRHPRISFYVGSRDGFAGENVAFDRLLTGLGVAHRFNLVPGAGHGWSLWSAHYDSELKFLAGGLR